MKMYLIIPITLIFILILYGLMERRHGFQMKDGRTYLIWSVIHAGGESSEYSEEPNEYDYFILGESEEGGVSLRGFPRRVKRVIAFFTGGIPEHMLPEGMGEYMADALGGFSSLAEARAWWDERKRPPSHAAEQLTITRRGNKLIVDTSWWDSPRYVFDLKWWGGVSY